MEIGSRPNSRLAHRTKTERFAGGRLEHFETWPIQIERPAKGRISGGVRCGTCDAEFTYRVFSVSATNTRKILWLVFGVGLLAVSVFCFVRIATFPPVDDTLPSTQNHPVGSLLIGAIGSLIAGAMFLALRYYEDGVRGPGRWFQRGRHTLRAR